jgi:hypothetical protein
MKTARTFVLVTVGSILVGAAALAASGQRFGSDIFHFHERTALADQGVEPGAGGEVDAMHNRQGHVDLQKFDITVNGLAPETPYEVDALIDGQPDFVPVDAFVTDNRGSAAIRYQKIVNDRGNGSANGRGKRALPAQMDPDNMEIGIAIVNTNVQPVLAADLLQPDRMQILIKRDISSDQVPALLMIHANDVKATVTITAFNLAPTNTYALALNNSIVETDNSNTAGKLSISTVLTNATDVLDLFSVTLLDNTGTNVVVGTSLP